ncbi:hypothetical protein FRC17_001771 [Serendipita sp. 399]|nr:hypothetical protein FRC17_001771 [Serendipita sp. 399]
MPSSTVSAATSSKKSPATIRLPDILGAMDRFELRTHPDEREVTRASNEWFNSYNMMPPHLFEKFVKCDFGLMTGMSYPDTDATRLRITADYMAILFAYDDLMDLPSSDLMNDKIASDKAAKIMMGVLTHPHKFRPVKGLPVATAFHDFWSRFCATSTPSMQKRFTDTTYEYVMAVKNQCGNRASEVCPTIEEYVALRRDTSAIKVTYAAVEYCLNLDVPDEAFYHPSVVALSEAGNDILSWANDVYSFDNEQCSGDCHNLVAVVAINKNITVQAAMEYVMSMLDSAIERFFEEWANVPSFGPEIDQKVQAYIKGLELYLSGSVFWHLESERYFGPRVHHVKDTLTVELRPLEEGAKCPFNLLYKLPTTLTSEVLSAYNPKQLQPRAEASTSALTTPTAGPAGHSHPSMMSVAAGIAAVSGVAVGPLVIGGAGPLGAERTEIVAPIPTTPHDPTSQQFPPAAIEAAAAGVPPPPSYETQRMLAKMMQLDEKQRFAFQQEYAQLQHQHHHQQVQQQQAVRHSPSHSHSHSGQSYPPLYSSPQQSYHQFDKTDYSTAAAVLPLPPTTSVEKSSSSDLTAILMVASVLMASSPMALITFIPLLALLIVPDAASSFPPLQLPLASVSASSFSIPVPQMFATTAPTTA